ncbi:uncharacterized [Tachysurus ichikawai]
MRPCSRTPVYLCGLEAPRQSAHPWSFVMLMALKRLFKWDSGAVVMEKLYPAELHTWSGYSGHKRAD